jgi:hypothetical protein
MQHIFQQGELFKTTDGGISWNEMENYRSFGGYYPIFNSVHFSDRNNGWIVSNDGFILSTTNGGDSWTAQSPAGQCTLHSTFFLDNNSGWVVGSGGTVLKTRIENINSVNDKDHGQLARTFGLSQNYPNPFNPSTIITFSLPTRSFVSLKVFDGLGREIGILVNKELVAGTYTVKWNASGMASGVYFYRLHAGTFTESKKLILLR